ncbi:MAG: MFS transporter [Gemmatimonadetes bacterium]|jgi:MFS family permease|nr:MFS transporter [Gemmatimonadota bacterium]
MVNHQTTIIVLLSALTVIASMGIRQSFGLFLQPISDDLGFGREVFSLALALQNLLFGLPLLGMVADRFGSRWVIFGGALVYAGGCLLVPLTEGPTDLHLTLGLMIGLGLSSTTYVVVLGAVAQVVAPERRSTAFGIVTAAGSFGTFALVPGIQWLIANQGWQAAFPVIAALVGSVAVLAFGFPAKAGRPEEKAEAADGTLLEALAKAKGHSGYWLLNAGFFVCGFHVAFIATHLPSFLTDGGLSSWVGATALSLIGLANICGSLLFGRLGDRYRKKYLLSALYFGRSLVIGLFLIVPLTNFTALLFGAFIGFLWLATVPLTSGTVAQIFGSRYLSTLYGVVFFSHQIGSFMGVWLAGRLYDSTGSYDVVWWMAIALGVLATLVHLPIADRPLQKQALTTA